MIWEKIALKRYFIRAEKVPVITIVTSSKHEDVSPTNVQRAIRSVLNDSGLKQVTDFNGGVY